MPDLFAIHTSEACILLNDLQDMRLGAQSPSAEHHVVSLALDLAILSPIRGKLLHIVQLRPLNLGHSFVCGALGGRPHSNLSVGVVAGGPSEGPDSYPQNGMHNSRISTSCSKIYD